MKLNLGCGSTVPDDWVNVDNGLGAKLAKIPLFPEISKKLKLLNLDWHKNIYIHDLTKTFPWREQSVDAVYSSHTLEHMSRENGKAFLMECHRVLKDDGIIRIVVPDLRFYIDEYIAGNLKAENFVEELGVLFKTSKNPIKNKLIPLMAYPHKCMYDHESLIRCLSEIGFSASTHEAFDSRIDGIRNIERPGRVVNAVIVEGKKIKK